MTTLHLGVIELPYTDVKDAKSTGDVAEILEGKYHIMEHFWELHNEEAIKALESALTGSFESLMLGASVAADVNAAGTVKIETMFKQFLSTQEMDSLGYPGIPTAAALHGVSHRFKHPYKKRAPRPSFIDTGTYQSSFKAWVD